MSVAEFIKQLQSYEEYSFSLNELIKNSIAPETTLKKELSRLMSKNEIIALRNGFYLIIPPRYNNLGKIPIQLYVDKLFKELDKPYYLALHSASSFHGAAHQQRQKDYVITTPPALRNIDKGNIGIDFFNLKKWSEKNIVEKKSDAGMFKISSPALTAADLVFFQSKIGGINSLLANLEELIEEITITDMENLLSWYPYKSTLQRLGLLMEELQTEDSLLNLIFDKLKEGNFYPTLLNPVKEQKAGSTGNRWKVDVNIKLESDI